MFTLNKDFCYFIVYASKDNDCIFDKIPKDMEHWQSVVPKIHLFWRFCVLPEILARWYTRKCHLKTTGETNNVAPCFCMSIKNEPTVKCSNPGCQIINFHPSCLKPKVYNFTDLWLCPICQLDERNKDNSVTVCVCKKRVKKSSIKSLLQCINTDCTNGNYFHLDCLGLKRKPNNYKTHYFCPKCKPLSKQAIKAEGVSTENNIQDVIVPSQNAVIVQTAKEVEDDLIYGGTVFDPKCQLAYLVV